MDSKMYLRTKGFHGKTIIEDVYFTAPYKIMSPFEKGGHIDIVQMCASAGMLDGDKFIFELDCMEGSDITYLSQSYDKIFTSRENKTIKDVHIRVASGARAVYMPYPVIPFADSDFEGKNDIYITKFSTFMYSDIISCGRVGMGERFAMKCYDSTTRIYVDGKMAYADHTLLAPKKFDYSGIGMWQEYTHAGFLYIHIPHMGMDEQKKRIRELPCGELSVGCSQCVDGIAVRVLGMSGDSIYQFFRLAEDLLL